LLVDGCIVKATGSKILSLLFLMIVVFFVFRFALAAYIFHDAESLFKNALQLEQSQKSQAFQFALKRVDQALNLRKNQAKALDLKGEILYRQWWLNPDGKSLESSTLLQQSKFFHEKSLAIRPEWPYTLLQLTRIEAHKPSLDEHFFQRFNQAFIYGKFETVIAFDLMRLGLLRWPELTAEAKEKVVEVTSISIQQKRNKLKKLRIILTDAGLYQYMCERVEKNSRQASLCHSISNVK